MLVFPLQTDTCYEGTDCSTKEKTLIVCINQNEHTAKYHIYLVVIGKWYDGSTYTQNQWWMDFTVSVSIRICFFWIEPCLNKILLHIFILIYIFMICIYVLLKGIYFHKFRVIKLTLMVMEIIVVSSSSVSIYSINPLDTRSCHPPSSGDSWRNRKRG